MSKKPRLIRMNDDVYIQLKIFSAEHQIRLGDAIKKLLENDKKAKEN